MDWSTGKLIRRHFFLVAALAVVVLMAVGATYKLTLGKAEGAGGGPPGAAGPGGPGGKGPGGRGGGGPAATVTAVAVQPRVFTDRLQVLGVAKGRESVTLTSNASEMIQAVRFRPGDQVRRGQVLVELKRDEEDADILEAQSDLSVAKLNADRWTELGRRGFAAKQQVEQYQAAYERARASLEAANSRRGDRVIRAPFNGVVGLTDIAPGALISPGTAIATLDDVSVIRVDFDVPDRYIAIVREGAAIVATNDAYPGERYNGRIAKLDTRIDERSRAIKARAEFPNPGGRLKPGMMMRVGIDRGARTAVAAPESAVNFTGGQAYVYRIGKRADGAFAQQQSVIVGLSDCGYIEIREGLKPGDTIILDGLNRIQPNQGVKVVAGPGAQARSGPAGKAPGGKAATAAPAKVAMNQPLVSTQRGCAVGPNQAMSK